METKKDTKQGNGTDSIGSGVDVQRLVSTRYQFKEDVAAHNPSPVTFDRMESPFYDGVKWAVRRGGAVLATTAEWEYEPMPSSRDDAFYDRCRFDSLEAALAAYDQSEC